MARYTYHVTREWVLLNLGFMEVFLQKVDHYEDHEVDDIEAVRQQFLSKKRVTGVRYERLD